MQFWLNFGLKEDFLVVPHSGYPSLCHTQHFANPYPPLGEVKVNLRKYFKVKQLKCLLLL